MSEWIDFFLYAAQVLLFWVALPRQGRKFTVPAIADRNAGWLANHRDVAARLERSRWFLNVCYFFAAVSIAVLLGIKLDVVVPPFGGTAPKWEVLKDVHGTFLIVGLLGWAACTLMWFRWIATNVPLSETRRATLKPRVQNDYLSRPWRIAVEALTLLHLGAWVAFGALGMAGGAKYWSAFVFIVAMSVLFAVVAALMPRRAAGFVDRMFGDGYRRAELRAAYLLRLTPLIAGGTMISEQVFGADPDRVGHLLLVSVVTSLMVVFLRLRPIEPGAPQGGAFTDQPRSSRASSINDAASSSVP